MLERLRRSWFLFFGLYRAHPGFTQLLAYHDGELGPKPTARVAAHLDRCSECSLEVRRIRMGLEQYAQAFVQDAVATSVQEGAEEFLRVLRDENIVSVERDRLREERNRRIVSALRTYFGSYPKLLLERASGDGPAFRTEAELLLQAFLGRSAASALLGRIDLEAGLA